MMAIFHFSIKFHFFLKLKDSAQRPLQLCFRFFKKKSNILHDFICICQGCFDFFFWDCLGSIKG